MGQPKDGQIQTGPATGGKLHRKEIDEEVLTPGSLHCISGDWWVGAIGGRLRYQRW